MKKYFLTTVLLCCAVIVFAQNSSSSSKSNRIEDLMNAEKFEFIANSANPLGQAPVDLVGNDYSVRFDEENLISFLPYFGVKRSGTVSSGKESAMNFQGKPQKYKVEKSGKNYVVTSEVKTSNDHYNLRLEASASGRATLTIKSEKYDAISYDGEIVE